MKNLYLLLSCCWLLGCSTIPDEIKAPENTELVAFDNAQSNKAAQLGKLARWGGVIATVENKAEYTMIEVVNFSLSSSARPQPDKETLGRFRIYYQGLLDPIIYEKGKSITAIGEIAAPEQGKIGDFSYDFPVLKANGIYLWKTVEQVDVRLPASARFGFYHNNPVGYYRYRYYPSNKSSTKIHNESFSKKVSQEIQHQKDKK